MHPRLPSALLSARMLACTLLCALCPGQGAVAQTAERRAAPAGALRETAGLDMLAAGEVPTVLSAEARPLLPVRNGANAVVTVRFAEKMAPVVTFRVEGAPLVLRDDGREGDERAGDGTFSGRMQVDYAAVQANHLRLAALGKVKGERIPVRRWLGRTMLVEPEGVVRPRDARRFTGPLNLMPFGNAAAVVADRSLMILTRR